MTARAENTIANRRPPSSRAIMDVKTTAAEVASAGTIRMLRNESPSKSRESFMRNGISGG
jgi:hypothetical protein